MDRALDVEADDQRRHRQVIAAMQSARPSVSAVPVASYLHAHNLRRRRVRCRGLPLFRARPSTQARRRRRLPACSLCTAEDLSRWAKCSCTGSSSLFEVWRRVAAGVPSGISFSKPAGSIAALVRNRRHGRRPSRPRATVAERRYRRAMLELAQTPAMAPPSLASSSSQSWTAFTARIGVGMGAISGLASSALLYLDGVQALVLLVVFQAVGAGRAGFTVEGDLDALLGPAPVLGRPGRW